MGTLMARSATLAEVVAEALEQSLRDGVYSCGERLPEITIAQEMNVSQNTVRDALRILEQEGWVIKQSRRGVSVRAFTVEEVEELYTLRTAIEQLALGWMMDSPPNTGQLAQIISAARTHADVNNASGLRETLFDFHETVVTLAGKSQTADLLQALHNQCRLLENLRAQYDSSRGEQCSNLVALYSTLLRHIENGERQTAQNLLHDIIMADCESLLPIVSLVS